MNKKILSLNTTFLLFVFFMLLSLVSNGQTTLLQFNFETRTANPNINNTAGTPTSVSVGVGNIDFVNDNTCGSGISSSLTGNSWNVNAHYRIAVNTTGFANMTFSYCNKTTNTNINSFDIRYSIDNGATITSIAPAYVPTTTGGTNSCVLPVAANNRPNVLIYIYKSNDAGSANTSLLVDNVTLNGHRIPTISSFTPNTSCAASGTSVVITGSNFTGATAVKFNGVDAVFTVNSNTQITAQLPVTATTGAITITTPGGTATSSTNISLVPPQGDQVIYGTGSWIGFVYANTNGGNPPTNAFSTNYRGYVTQTENFDLNLVDGSLSGPNLCGSYADNFAVRFKMNRNLPAGCYTFTVGGDDGYRLSLDGGLTYVVNNWGAHSYVETTYTVYLSGNTNFVLEYFENLGQSRLRFSSVFSSLVTPTVGTVNQPNCVVTTGDIPLSGLPASGTWTIIASPNTTGLTGLTGTGGTTTVGGLVAGTTYAFAVSNTTCTSPVTSNVVVDNVVTTTFNGSTWTSPPTISKIGIIAAPSASPITISSNTELCSCTVNTNSKIIVNQNVTLKLQDKLTINGSGTLTFQNNASLIQINNIGNSGNIIYERETAPIKRYDYTYWSSPVSNQKLIDVSPNTDYDKFYSFNATIDNWKQENPQDFMQRGIGYIIRAPENISAPPAPLGVYQANFVGVPFNGPLTITGISQDRSYLLGNPYPSALSADRFLNANSSVLDGTLYFWTHNTAIGIGVSNPGSGVYAYSSDDYATYNLTGGVGIGTGNSINNAEQTINKPTGKIAAGQAFFTSSKLSPTGTVIDFNNSMRLDVNGAILNNNQFFKVKSATKKTNTLERNRVWLNLTNTQGAFKQMLVGYVTNATDGFDSSFDGPSYNGNDFIDFYSISDDVAMTIQGRILPFDENDSVSLGYSSVIEGVFSISIDEVDGVFASQNIYLEDKFSNSIHDLKKAAYSFETATGTFDDRFVLRYTDKKLGVGDFVTTGTEVLVSVKNKRIKINSSVQSIDKVFIYDMLGKKLYEKINVENMELVIPNLGSSEQFLIVKTVLQNGNVVTAKTIY
ncbi:T9SS sorting signal type C domain-containing protein [Flavobacterium sp. DSR3-2]|uniref:T9SS sorting signal type C domain-containing protein n=1 Tax=Flavobacterium sp. DSR3-2 TaxID=2804634 RepID=UPI003CF32899